MLVAGRAHNPADLVGRWFLGDHRPWIRIKDSGVLEVWDMQVALP
jgi:hypothetical protein